MAIENEVWSEIKITVGTKDIEVAGNIANMVVPYHHIRRIDFKGITS